MKKRMLGLVLLVLGMLSVTREASADERVNPDAVLGVVGFGALDIGLIAADLSAGAQEKWRSRGYGGFETAVGGTQLAICLNQVLATPQNGGSPGAWEIGAGLGAILVVHGLVTLLAPRSHTEAPAPSGGFTVAPLALSDVARAPVPGMALLGRF
jgi:hypothetical protein